MDMCMRTPRFSGHQTFAFRYGWLEKGYDFAAHNKSFSDSTALIELGVGKNMVESIRYWGLVFDLFTEQGPTPFASKLLASDGGWDPYLEDDASLWLLHWRLCTASPFMTAASILFGEVQKGEISREEWLELLSKRETLYRSTRKKHSALDEVFVENVQTKSVRSKTARSILERDIDCCLKMYVPSKNTSKNMLRELSAACPFQELGLLSFFENNDAVRFRFGAKVGLAPHVLGYALHDYLLRTGSGQSVRLSQVLHDKYSPGQVFLLNENTFISGIEQLQRLEHWGQYFTMTASEGVNLVHCRLPGDGLALLEDYYAPKE